MTIASPSRRRAWSRAGVRLACGAAALVVALASMAATAAWMGNHAARESLPKAFRASLDAGAPTSTNAPYNVLLVGTDRRRGERGAGRADSVSLLRVDPRRKEVATMSVPRNLAVLMPNGEAQLAHLMQAGGIPRLTRVVESQLNIDVRHVMHVDTMRLARIVDAVGGIAVDNPSALRNRTYRDRLWTFRRGHLHLDGEAALAFSRIRTNELDPNESDSSRGLRQQLVVSALASRLLSPDLLVRPQAIRTIGASLRTDMHATELARAAWAVRDAKQRVRCRLGGTFRGSRPRARRDAPRERVELRIARPAFLVQRDGMLQDPWLLDPSPYNRIVIDQFLGRASVERRTWGDGPYPVGCVSER